MLFNRAISPLYLARTSIALVFTLAFVGGMEKGLYAKPKPCAIQVTGLESLEQIDTLPKTLEGRVLQTQILATKGSPAHYARWTLDKNDIAEGRGVVPLLTDGTRTIVFVDASSDERDQFQLHFHNGRTRIPVREIAGTLVGAALLGNGDLFLATSQRNRDGDRGAYVSYSLRDRDGNVRYFKTLTESASHPRWDFLLPLPDGRLVIVASNALNFQNSSTSYSISASIIDANRRLPTRRIIGELLPTGINLEKIRLTAYPRHIVRNGKDYLQLQFQEYSFKEQRGKSVEIAGPIQTKTFALN